MRTTVDLPEDLHHIVTSLALHTRRSLSTTAVDLIRRGLAAGSRGAAKGEPPFSTHPRTGLPVVKLPRVITADDVKALEDEA